MRVDPEDARECLADVAERQGFSSMAACLIAGQVAPVECSGELAIAAMVEFAERMVAVSQAEQAD